MGRSSIKVFVGVVLVIAAVILGGELAQWRNRVDDQIEFATKCQAGRFEEACLAHLGDQKVEGYLVDGSRVRLFKSSARRNSDIVIVSKDRIITEVLNIDRESERNYYRQKYQPYQP